MCIITCRATSYDYIIDISVKAVGDINIAKPDHVGRMKRVEKVKDVDILVDGNDNLLVMDNTSVGCVIGDSISVAHFAIIFDIYITKPLRIVMHA